MWLKSLTDEQREALLGLAHNVVVSDGILDPNEEDMLDEFTARNATALRTLVEEHGVDVRRLPDDVLARFAEFSDDVLDETAATDELSQRILDSYRAFQGSVREYHAITEQSYLDTRAGVD